MNRIMRLQLLLPTEVLLDCEAYKLIAEAENGSFCLLPRHIDFVTTLVPGILEIIDSAQARHYYAIDRGVLVKCGGEIRVSTFNAVYGRDLFTLRETIEKHFLVLNEHERQARSALARLEAGAIRRFMQLEEWQRG